MGEWSIGIQGHGIHDNGPRDESGANGERLDEELAKSQQVASVTFTVGARRDLTQKVSL